MYIATSNRMQSLSMWRGRGGTEAIASGRSRGGRCQAPTKTSFYIFSTTSTKISKSRYAYYTLSYSYKLISASWNDLAHCGQLLIVFRSESDWYLLVKENACPFDLLSS